MESETALQKIRKASKKVRKTMVDSGKKETESRSPSRLSARVLGKPWAEGIVVGYKSENPLQQIANDLRTGTHRMKLASAMDLKNAASNINYAKMGEAVKDAFVASGVKMEVNGRDFARVVEGC